MAYVINEQCIKCKYMDCVEVCPVDCFYEGENMLVINPEECINCGICQPECPAEAIAPDSAPGAKQWIEVNRRYSQLWPGVTRKRAPATDADQWKGMQNKFDRFFSVEPGDVKSTDA
jgi:ferredoxin